VSEHNQLRAGVYSGLFAVIMIVALSVMAIVALEPQRGPPLRTAEIDVSLLDLPIHDVPRPMLDLM
jgi:hypothetical protein